MFSGAKGFSKWREAIRCRSSRGNYRLLTRWTSDPGSPLRFRLHLVVNSLAMSRQILFGGEHSWPTFTPVNDTVRGGASTSHWRVLDGNLARFSGHLGEFDVLQRQGL